MCLPPVNIITTEVCVSQVCELLYQTIKKGSYDIPSIVKGEQMYIQANLPEDFGALEKIKRDNYPFNRGLEHFIKNLSSLHKTLGLDFYDTLGYIESELIFIGTEPHVDPTKSSMTIRIKTFDKDIIDLYESSPISNKLTTVAIFRLIIRLSEIYNSSLNHMSYKLKALERELLQKPIVYPETPKAEVKPVETKVKTRKLPDLQPRERVSTPVSTPKPAPKPEPVTDTIDELSQRAATIVKKMDETKAAPGTKVTSNPLLADFL